MYNSEPVTVGEWVITFIVTAIPVVGLIMLFVWAFGNTKTSKANYAKAALILAVVGILISIIFSFLFSFSFANLASNYGY